jgi:UDP-glucuronate 4-epimerase
MSTLITGAAGFLGSSLTDRLVSMGEEVVGLDSFDPFYDRTIKEANLVGARSSGCFSLVEGDIRDGEILDSLPDTIDNVVHLAALAGVRPSIENPQAYCSVNEGGTWSVLAWAKRRGIKNMVFASSSSVYGNCPKAPFHEDMFVGAPISPYAATKRAGELACHTHHHLDGLSLVAARFFTVYGPRQRPDLAIHKFARLIRDGRPIPVFGDGSSSRDYTYVDDIVDGILQARAFVRGSSDPVFEIVNLGESRTVTLSEMINVVGDEMGESPEIERLPMQPGDVSRTLADVSKARRLIGYEPSTDFRAGIRRFLEWFDTPSD